MTASYLHETIRRDWWEETRAGREIIGAAPCGIVPPQLTRRYRGRMLGRFGLVSKVWDWVSPQ